MEQKYFLLDSLTLQINSYMMCANSEQVGGWANFKPEVDVELGHFSTERREAQCEYCLY